jgi:glutamate:Na+ symporter, ESS family
MPIDLGTLPSLIVAISILFSGYLLVARVRVLAHYNIPVPVAGGILFAALFALLYTQTPLRLSFDTELRAFFMMAFFTTVGLGADLTQLRKGGKNLLLLLIVVVLFLTVQNAVGTGMAYLLDLHPSIGLLAGSITLSGGHGTGAAYAERFGAVQNLHGVMELTLASATFGLVIGGLIGGPVAQFLISRHGLSAQQTEDKTDQAESVSESLSSRSVLETLLLILIGVVAGEALSRLFADAPITLPSFIWALFIGVLLRNGLGLVRLYRVHGRSLDLLGSLSLWLALAFAFMGLKLWELIGLAGPLLVIMVAQTLAMVLFSVLVTFRVMGSDYDAAVMAGGHCGFGMGATPTAIANMQAVTGRYGASPQAFIVIPLVGAFFIDLANALVIQGYLALPLHGF